MDWKKNISRVREKSSRNKLNGFFKFSRLQLEIPFRSLLLLIAVVVSFEGTIIFIWWMSKCNSIKCAWRYCKKNFSSMYCYFVHAFTFLCPLLKPLSICMLLSKSRDLRAANKIIFLHFLSLFLSLSSHNFFSLCFISTLWWNSFFSLFSTILRKNERERHPQTCNSRVYKIFT